MFVPITLSIISNRICKTVQTKPLFGFYEIKRMVPTQRRQNIDHLFQYLVLPKISHGLPVYASSLPELNTVQQFLRRCLKRRFISYTIDIYHFLEKKKKTDKSISKKISCPPTYPLYNLLPTVKESSKRLRTQTSLLPCVNTQLFKGTVALLIDCILNILLLFN